MFDFDSSNNMTEGILFKLPILKYLENLHKQVISGRGIFYLDSGHSFDNSLFYGNENLLVQFELMIFLVVTIISENFLIAIIIVGAINQVRGL